MYTVIPPIAPTAPNSAGIFQDGYDYSYFIQAKIGSSGKPLYMLLDSGAGPTWVMARTCKAEACGLHETFGPEDSKTLKLEDQTFILKYGTGNVTCQVVRDSVTVGGVTVNMSFGLASNMTDHFVHFPFDGILGLSMNKGTTDPFMAAMLEKKEIAAKVFSISLSRHSDGFNNGQITFGGVDPTQFTGDISYSPISPGANGEWAIAMEDIGHDGKSAGIKGRDAIIDTGTSMAFGKPEDVAAFHKTIIGATTEDNITYAVPCSTKPITVKFGGLAYNIPAKDWQMAWNETTCYSNVMGIDSAKGKWLMGDMFLKNVYAVFDIGQSRIGFAAKVPPPATSKGGSGKPTATGPGMAPIVSPFVPSPDGSGAPTPGGQQGAPATSSVTPEQVSLGGRLEIQSLLSVFSALAIAITLAS